LGELLRFRIFLDN